MSPRGKPVGRLPGHLQHLNKAGGAQKADGPAKPKRAEPTEKAASGAPDRIASLLPELLRAMLGEGAPRSGQVVEQGQLLAALAPYHRPKSRFEQLVVRRLVGEGYLRPLGARDKYGLSGAYELTPKGEALLGGRRPRP